PIATRPPSRVRAIVSTNAPAVFTSAISETLAASGRAGGASRQPLTSRAIPSPTVAERLTRKSYDGGRARNESAVSCSRDRPPGRRDLRAVPLLPLAGRRVRANGAGRASRRAWRRHLDARPARGRRDPSRRRHRSHHRVVPERPLAGLQ